MKVFTRNLPPVEAEDLRTPDMRENLPDVSFVPDDHPHPPVPDPVPPVPGLVPPVPVPVPPVPVPVPPVPVPVPPVPGLLPGARPGRHIPTVPPRGFRPRIEFDYSDISFLDNVFNDEDTTAAASDIIMNAPPEMQVIIVQLADVIGKNPEFVNSLSLPEPAHLPRYENSVLDEEAREKYREIYGDLGDSFIDILNSSPEEIAVISRLIAFIRSARSTEEDGHNQDD